MAAYLIAHLTVTDPEAFQDYQRVVPAVVQRFGGRYLMRGGAVETLEGQWRVPRLVVIEFPSLDQAKDFYRSADYQKILPIRLAAAQGEVVLAEGI
jgi:uncharacterized protein (DUF1330 family)